MTFFWGTLTVLGYLLTLLLLPIVLLTKKQNSVSTVAWMMAIVTLPYLGGLLFVVFGINRVARRAAGKQQATLAISRHLPELSQYQLIPSEALSPQQARLMRLASRVAGTAATFGNQVEVLDDTNRTLGLIEQAILSARQTLHLEYYIWQPDKTGTRIRDLLIQKAREGVQVRFLYDKIGSLFLSRRFLKPMRDAGIQVASFLPGASFRERWSFNLRNHRKIVICDGQVGFTGGMNIGDEYLGRNPHLGYWRDTHLRLRGPTVLQLQQVFVEDWYYATGEELTQPEIFPPPEESGRISAQVLAGGPDGDFDVFHALMFAAINEAREQILLATSYFVPPVPLVTALETAAHRGVRVRLLVTGRAVHHWTVLAGRSFYHTLLKAGVELHEYQGGLLHSKTLSIDGAWSLVGTPNFDSRSLLLNFEVAVALYDAKVAGQLDEQFASDLKWSRKIELEDWQKRPLAHHVGESVCRLFAPVM
jgi:cardiolipin synthase